MYVPSAFRIEDRELMRRIVRENPFAILFSNGAHGPIATHLPLLLHTTDGDVLHGHLAKASPHASALFDAGLAVFSGPHGYVSPSWYVSGRSVPTWNYVSVHAYGTPEPVEGEAAIAHLMDLVHTFDPTLSETNPECVDESYVRAQLNGLVAFRMPVDRWDAKAKLNQNRSQDDQMAVRARYVVSDDPDERRMGAMMPLPLNAEP